MLYNGSLLCGFNVPIKRLKRRPHWRQCHVFRRQKQSLSTCCIPVCDGWSNSSYSSDTSDRNYCSWCPSTVLCSRQNLVGDLSMNAANMTYVHVVAGVWQRLQPSCCCQSQTFLAIFLRCRRRPRAVDRKRANLLAGSLARVVPRDCIE